ncbi:MULTISPECIES: hypothetical protein [unclassified Treponema]|uniref:hypothetical protein n=1 Tax=unclassified Treponema TaxID=2638727 RepID=UPI0020A29C79|nr:MULTISPECIES: hypothetical protein [unclassified Treponema]UTC66292.1 hypothetical protein E4O06_09935 [Treponema sp. OMZ 789]UTC69022.1 hypothetical protein E4O01_10085 [Treponema sp. OMZ 790]UTC71734.1 hypothetical protein E4O02_10175 [Treponema sp. OMZ 791]
MRNKFIFFVAILMAVIFAAGCASGKNMKDGMMHNDMMDDNMMMADYVLESGTVMSGDAMGSQLLIKSNAMGKESDVILTIQETTPAIDAVSGASTKKSDIKKGVKIHAWVSSAYAASMPPKTAAKVILVNAKDMTSVPVLIEVAGISSVKDGMTITAKDGSMWMFEKNAMIEMYAAKEKINASALKKGAKVLVWKDGMMMKDDMKSDMMMKDDMKSDKMMKDNMKKDEMKSDMMKKDDMKSDKMMMKGPHKVKKILIIEK